MNVQLELRNRQECRLESFSGLEFLIDDAVSEQGNTSIFSRWLKALETCIMNSRCMGDQSFAFTKGFLSERNCGQCPARRHAGQL